MVADFQEVYSFSLTPASLADQTWPWLVTRITGLLTRPARYVQIDVEKGLQIVRIPTTRLGMQLSPPAWPEPRK